MVPSPQQIPKAQGNGSVWRGWLLYESQSHLLAGGKSERPGREAIKYLLSPATFVLWPSWDCAFISDSLRSCFWFTLDFQEQECMYIIRGRDKQKQLCQSPCFPVLTSGTLDLGAGHTVMKTTAAVWLRVACARGQGPSSTVDVAPRH